MPHAPLSSSPQVQRHPGGKDGMFRSYCICGYISGFDTERGARASLQQHIDAKEANELREVMADPADLRSIPFEAGCTRCDDLRDNYHPGAHTWIIATATHLRDEHQISLVKS